MTFSASTTALQRSRSRATTPTVTATYFDTKTFPMWTFMSTTIVPSGNSAYAMDGMLTMHGVTRPEHFDVTVRGNSVHPVYHAVGHIDRHVFGMKGARLDPVIGNAAGVTLDVALK
jgi:polyisoprenoid-binding protein YceI